MAYTILITDDSSTTRAVIKRTITLSGVAVKEMIEASDGMQALEKLRGNKIDLLFLDLNMPNMTGMELVAKVRAEPGIAGTPICIVSSEATTSRMEQLNAQGVQGYIKKPFTPEQIRSAILHTLTNAYTA